MMGFEFDLRCQFRVRAFCCVRKHNICLRTNVFGIEIIQSSGDRNQRPSKPTDSRAVRTEKNREAAP
jgi:hypothetical protein